MSISDLELNKFELDYGKVSVDVTESFQGLDDIGERNINDLEKDKFESDGTIRIVTAI